MYIQTHQPQSGMVEQPKTSVAYPGFLLSPNFGRKRFTDHLRKEFPLAIDKDQPVDRQFLETFDWRLWAGGVMLFAKATPHGHALILQDHDTHYTLTSLRSKVLPAWPTDIPDSDLQRRVAGLVEMRVLLPLVRTRSQSQVLRVLNDDEKTVVRLVVEEVQCEAGDGDKPRKLLPRVRLVPVKGYAAEFEAVARFLREELGLPEAPRGLFDEALAAMGREPGDYSSKLDIRLAPEMRGDAAARRIFTHLLKTLESNIEGTRADSDSEFLHDLRVATRRTRSALTQIKGVLPEKVLTDFKERFGWLGQVTGPTRDLDVFLLSFPGYREEIAEGLRADLDPLRDYLRIHQKQEQKALRRKLDSPRFRKLIEEWRAYLESELPTAPEAPNALSRAKDLADERIWRMFRRVLKEGRAVHDTSPPEELHELRKSCKKLRYLVEFFQSLYPVAQLQPLIKAIKRLLDSLGEYQDLEVQAAKLAGFAEGMQVEGKVAVRTLLAMGALIGELLRRQANARAVFKERFSEFDTADHRAAYRALFKASPAEASA